jgi:hypothetical protein
MRGDNYDPSHLPNAEEWLSLGEQDRIDLVLDYHEEAGIELLDSGQKTVHATMHVIVENNIALNVEPVPQTVAKLIRQGLGRHEAIHAIAAILVEDIVDILIKDQDSDVKRNRRRLEKLTAKRWRKGQY